MDPQFHSLTPNTQLSETMFDPLVRTDRNAKPVPCLAQSWTVNGNEWIFKLRPDVKFSDGTPLTADDVVYTFTTITDPKFNAPDRGLYSPITKVEAVDPDTVKFTLNAPYAPLLSYLDKGIVSKAAAESGRDLATNPLGEGPMTLKNWTRGDNIELVANPNYWAGSPKVTDVVVKIVGDNSARAQAFEAGDLDVIQSPLSPNDIKRLEADSRFGNVIEAGLGVTYINYNTKDPLLADPGMRQAFSMMPAELFDAARVEGVKEWRIFLFVALPLARPMLAALAIILFLASWNNYLWPLLINSQPGAMTAPVALGTLIGLTKVSWGGIMAGAMMLTVPMLIVFVLLQRHFIAGIAAGAVK